MVKIEVGREYQALRVRSGTSNVGNWELIVVKGEGRGGQELTIFPVNKPTGIKEGGNFVVNRIDGVEVKKGKNKDGSWGANQTRVDAIVTASEIFTIEDFVDNDESDPFADISADI